DVLLVGHRDVEAGEPQGGNGGPGVGAPSPGDREGDVDPVEPERLEGGVVQGGRERARHGVTDDADDPGVTGQRRPAGTYDQMSPLRRASALRASNSAGVVAKACLPFLSEST